MGVILTIYAGLPHLAYLPMVVWGGQSMPVQWPDPQRGVEVPYILFCDTPRSAHDLCLDLAWPKLGLGLQSKLGLQF